MVAGAGGGVGASPTTSSYAGFFALFLAFNNWQEIRAEQAGPSSTCSTSRRPDAPGGVEDDAGAGATCAVRGAERAVLGAPTLTPTDPARAGAAGVGRPCGPGTPPPLDG